MVVSSHSNMYWIVQGKRWAKLQRYSDWSLLLLFRERGQELQIRRKELPKQNQRQQSTKNFSPPGWRSKGNAVVRVWLRRDQGFPVLSQLSQHRLLWHRWSSYFAWVFDSIIWRWCLFYAILQFQQCCFNTFLCSMD